MVAHRPSPADEGRVQARRRRHVPATRAGEHLAPRRIRLVLRPLAAPRRERGTDARHARRGAAPGCRCGRQHHSAPQRPPHLRPRPDPLACAAALSDGASRVPLQRHGRAGQGAAAAADQPSDGDPYARKRGRVLNRSAARALFRGRLVPARRVLAIPISEGGCTRGRRRAAHEDPLSLSRGRAHAPPRQRDRCRHRAPPRAPPARPPPTTRILDAAARRSRRRRRRRRCPRRRFRQRARVRDRCHGARDPERRRPAMVLRRARAWRRAAVCRLLRTPVPAQLPVPADARQGLPGGGVARACGHCPLCALRCRSLFGACRGARPRAARRGRGDARRRCG
mmetsp:Transcript_72475/g.198588  ORF Transcript_72475/g.198588 Transcript_72475/m.198588 type:complete len:339 (+) Transcript_72475:238-1254(+)